MNKTELKGNGLIGLAEEISRQKNIQAAEWLLFTLFTQIGSEREQKVEQEDVKIVLLAREGVIWLQLWTEMCSLMRKRA